MKVPQPVVDGKSIVTSLTQRVEESGYWGEFDFAQN